MSESHNHEVLKLKAIEFLYQVKKCKLVATEFSFGQYIYDVIGTDFKRIYIIEAKQAKADFKRDCNSPQDIRKNVNDFKKLLRESGDTKYIDLIAKEKRKSTKFYNKAVFKLANECYIIAPDELVEEDEVPPEWGLLNEEPRTIKKCTNRKVATKWITRVVGEIGKKHTKLYLKSIGVEFHGRKVIFPEHYLLDKDEQIKEEE